MATPLHEELTEAVFRTALEPDAWDEVMRLMKLRFPSEAQAFYFLHLKPHRVQPVCLLGVEPQWRESFDSYYFASDNPWIRLTQQLHRLGVVAPTNVSSECWGIRLRCIDPPTTTTGCGHRASSTASAIPCLRTKAWSPISPCCDRRIWRPSNDEEVRAFESLSRHLTRSLQISVRLERAEASSNSIGAPDGLPLAVALVDAKLQLLYANGAMESLLRTRRGLALSQGALHASSEEQRRLLACVSNALASIAEEVCPAPPLVLRFQQGTQLTLHAVPVTGSRWRYVPSKPVVLLMASNPGDERCGSCDALRETYDFTRSESRLAQLLTRGSELRRAAKEMGITYGTARGYLKVMFEKVGVHSQAQLVSRLLR